MAFGIGSFLKGVGDDLGDALIPKEIAPYLGTIGALIAPVAPIAGLTMGQLASMKMNEGKLDPMQALAVGLGYYGGGGPQNRAEGKLFGQRLKRGFQTGDGKFFDMAGFKGNYLDNPDLIPKGETLSGRYDEMLGKVDYGEGSAYKQGEDKFIKDSLGKGEKVSDLTDLEIAELKGDFFTSTGAGTTDPSASLQYRDRTGITGNIKDIVQTTGETVMPGFKGADGKFSFTKALTTVGTATTLSTLGMAAEAIKKQKELDEAEQGRIWKEWFDGYKRVTGKEYYNKETGLANAGELADPTLVEKYKQFMATGGRVGYNMGGDTGIIAAAPGMPRGMQLDGRDGIFVSQGIKEKADDVPAMLSKNEFVLTADSMKGFDKMTGGDGNPRAAAQKMYQLMDQMEAIA